jgi:hypothetical protein
MRAPRPRDILWGMKRGARNRYAQTHRLAAVMLAPMAGGLTGTLANAQSIDLITAAGRGDLPVVNALLKSGADVNDDKNTILGPGGVNDPGIALLRSWQHTRRRRGWAFTGVTSRVGEVGGCVQSRTR